MLKIGPCVRKNIGGCQQPMRFLGRSWLPLKDAPPKNDNSRAELPASQGQLSDRSLLRRYRSGDQWAATQIYLRYAHRLRALARARCSRLWTHRCDDEDIVQSVFRIFFRGAKRGLYDVPDGEELWKLILVIALNKIR